MTLAAAAPIHADDDDFVVPEEKPTRETAARYFADVAHFQLGMIFGSYMGMHMEPTDLQVDKGAAVLTHVGYELMQPAGDKVGQRAVMHHIQRFLAPSFNGRFSADTRFSPRQRQQLIFEASRKLSHRCLNLTAADRRMLNAYFPVSPFAKALLCQASLRALSVL